MSLQQWSGAQRVTLALVFTDIVGSTRLANRFGDEKWIEIMVAHAERGRYLMRGVDCYEIKMIGDAFMIAFRTADDAVDFAFQFQADTGHPIVKMRAGIYVGSVYIVDDDLYGKTVNYAARVVKAVAGDWIALSDAAKNDIDLNRFPPPNRIWRALTKEKDESKLDWLRCLSNPCRQKNH
jgi:class 3 adenylate cyclase